MQSCQQDLIRLLPKLQAIPAESTFPKGEGSDGCLIDKPQFVDLASQSTQASPCEWGGGPRSGSEGNPFPVCRLTRLRYRRGRDGMPYPPFGVLPHSQGNFARGKVIPPPAGWHGSNRRFEARHRGEAWATGKLAHHLNKPRFVNLAPALRLLPSASTGQIRFSVLICQ